MPKKKTHEEFVEEVRNAVGDEYTVVGKYITARKNIEILHNKCGNVWNVVPHSFQAGRRCGHCYGKKRGDTERFKKRVAELTGNDYIVLGEYVKNSVHILMKHTLCGHEWKVTPANFQRGHGCPNCAGNIALTHEDFERRVFDLVGEEYTVVGLYTSTNKCVEFKHNTCGGEFPMTPGDFRRGRRCPHCFRKHKKTQEQFEKEVYSLVGDEYKVIGEYKNTDSNIKMRHDVCGHEYPVFPKNFLLGNRCPRCLQSKGEVVIEEWLKSNNIEYKLQYRLKGCKYKKHLPFDFAVFSNDKLVALIEYDGKQHYNPVDFWGGEKNLEKQQLKDQIKNSYCKANNIPLIRIPYWEQENAHILLEGCLKDMLDSVAL